MTARLLHHEKLTHETGDPSKCLLMLHGIFGSGRNWLQVARKLLAQRPDWAVVLVDLPGHGKSASVKAATLDDVADALYRLVESLELPAAAMLGHSFGGKVALRYAEAADGLAQVWIADASPAPAEPGGAGWDMLQTVRQLPDAFEDRNAAVAALVDAGYAEPVARWMAMNLVRRKAGMTWRFDVGNIERLLRDFYAADLWDIVERDTNGLRLDFIKAADSDVLAEADCRRIAAAAQSNARIHLHQVSGGHWINVANPDAVVDLLADRLVVSDS